jgi:hypothetical protein
MSGITARFYFPGHWDLDNDDDSLFRHLTDYEIAMRWQEWKIKHPTNNQYNHADDWAWRTVPFGLPMVYWLDGSHQVRFDEAWQMLLWSGINPGMDPKRWRIMWDWMRAFSNGLGKGFDTRSLFMRSLAFVISRTSHNFRSVMPATLQNGYVPVKDYPNKIDLKGDTPYLAKDKIRVCGNTIVKIKRDSNGQLMIDSDNFGVVETLDGNKPAPDSKWLLSRPHLWFFANNVHYNKQTRGQGISPFPYNPNDPGGCRVPLVAKREIKVFMPALQPLKEVPADPDFPQYPINPYKTYLYV